MSQDTTAREDQTAAAYDLLNLTPEQLGVIMQALELHSRMAMGQLGYLLEHPELSSRFMASPMDRDELEEPLNELKRKLFGLSSNASHGIHSDKIGDQARIAWDIQRVIRHRLAWDREGNPPTRDWKTMMGVHFDAPDNASSKTGVAFPGIRASSSGKASTE